MTGKITLYINTLKYLKPSQISYRLINRGKRELYKKRILKIDVPKEIKVKENHNYIVPEMDFEKDFLNRFDIDGIMHGRFTFINITNQVELSKAWKNNDLQHLWRYNLHYFEYLYKLAREYSKGKNRDIYYKRYKELINNWIENNPYPYGDGWHPYTISLRISNWIAAYQVFKDKINLDEDFFIRLKESLYLQYKYLQKNLEKDVLGNHYFENIKAITIGSIFFEDKKIKDKFKREILKQLGEQILEDGMHFELSPMYHKIILEDLIKIAYWLKDDSIYNQLIPYLQKMIDVTYSIEKNFGKTPAFNDSANGVSKSYQCLLEACNIYFDLRPQNKTNFDKSGFYIIEDQTKKLIFDTGKICPTYLPAHGHCDALSFELTIKGSPFIVNSGTYQYEVGEWRNFFRSTKAHNTISISNQEQSQFWGNFRVAKRIKKVSRRQFKYKEIQWVAGKYISYFGAEHKRFIGYINRNLIIVSDYVNAQTKDNIQSYLHFVPESNLDIKNNVAYAFHNNGAIKITPIGTSRIDLEQGWYSEQFNQKEKNNHLIIHKDKSKECFGFLINIGSSEDNIMEYENGFKLLGDKELNINFDELRDML